NNQNVRIEGDYINKDNSDFAADDTKHNQTYGSYTNVHKNAEPLYWQNTGSVSVKNYINGDASGGFTDYFILKVSWNKASVLNNKETDMIYITAGMTN
ncbi:MAG: hypothetical protein ACI4JN_00195, partial [Ruminococcus sp.]